MKPFLRALRRESQTPSPIWLMRQAGRYLPEYRELRARGGSFLDLCYTPELAAEATLQPIRRFGLDAAIVFSDILVIPHALGQEVSFEAGEGPRLGPLRSAAELAQLSRTRMVETLAPVYAALRLTAAALDARTALIGFAGAPWTLATYMVEGGSSRDFAAVKTWAYGDPDGFHRLIDILVEAVTDHLAAQVAAGAEAVQLFESWAGALSASEFQRWSVAPTRRIVDGLRKRGIAAPVIGFPRAAGFGIASYARDSGVDAIGLDPAVPLAEARTLQKSVVVQGNLDPVLLLTGGRAMREAASAILDALAPGPFVFNLGHGVLPSTPPEHVAELVALVRAWRP
jgi:uroporphyrinogen decarboxylase